MRTRSNLWLTDHPLHLQKARVRESQTVLTLDKCERTCPIILFRNWITANFFFVCATSTTSASFRRRSNVTAACTHASSKDATMSSTTGSAGLSRPPGRLFRSLRRVSCPFTACSDGRVLSFGYRLRLQSFCSKPQSFRARRDERQRAPFTFGHRGRYETGHSPSRSPMWHLQSTTFAGHLHPYGPAFTFPTFKRSGGEGQHSLPCSSGPHAQ